MSGALYGGKIARNLLILQLVTFVLFSICLSIKSVGWGWSALLGGLSAWLPNAVFMLFALGSRAEVRAEGRIAWAFALGEALKMVCTIALLIVSLGGFKAVFLPLGLTYIAVLVVQVAAPAFISRN
ncbi:F0F1 ATP synthase subunit I [Edwardsiella ictaluri]|uniref:ATP synthase F0, I subunit, putative n=1 Tax=Edwardsiella ictaluri (strain 93-146) TaxID=634503 RepID=C5BF33_EDWI9|nr:F0F1 ATP synthase subunit I [Edwardsiella ictaluri]ACR71016.2 ATP synthase F0, I subunit, putative [Edwardsiella ictaluri 93-146]ARD40923.1 F0F1 ATP synthase subunit I [Edwardsiella ictaluri]AVZ84043.1 F0F1 ATP synthase subunit I [Edwardsiella ictaluri]EKS7763451.1 F0F1 ATP synthase subunit I [Edwardsiella ictaluri]EKS7770271.1 F0F1 ATP synthase subunit I [Edwardsiella ictaluri]